MLLVAAQAPPPAFKLKDTLEDCATRSRGPDDTVITPELVAVSDRVALVVWKAPAVLKVTALERVMDAPGWLIETWPAVDDRVTPSLPAPERAPCEAVKLTLLEAMMLAD